jgi:hypothetical protein
VVPVVVIIIIIIKYMLNHIGIKTKQCSRTVEGKISIPVYFYSNNLEVKLRKNRIESNTSSSKNIEN